MPNNNPVWSNVKIGNHSVMFEGSERYAKTPDPAKSVMTGRPDPAQPKASIATRRESNPIVRYAPLVYLHPQEQFLPASGAFFINNSELRWKHDWGCKSCRVAKRGEVNISKLGSGGYKHQTRLPLPLCVHTGRHFTSREETAPGRGKVSAEGFYLELADSSRHGQGITSSVYYDYRPHRYIIYWFFYCNNKKSLDQHEGDWENITVRLNGKNEATEIAYYSHGEPKLYDWNDWKKINHHRTTHPIVYSANGSHASYPNEGTHPTGVPGVHDSTKKGKMWRAWAHLKNVHDMPWFRYGGAWGHIGKLLVGRNLDKLLIPNLLIRRGVSKLSEYANMTSGPLGPGHKWPIPRGW